MRSPRWLLLGVGLVAGACQRPAVAPATDAPEPPAAAQKPPWGKRVPKGARLYEGSGLVLDKLGVGPQLCLGTVLDSLPPQCRGIPLAGWDWTAVTGEKTAADTTWGSYRVVGTYDGHRMTPTEPPRPPGPSSTTDDNPFETPCTEPAGGWARPDPKKMGRDDLVSVNLAAQQMPGFAGLWLYHPVRPTSEHEALKDVVLNVAFTGELAAREVELRKLWGGPLCVTRHKHTEAELAAIRVEAERMIREMGLENQGSDIDVIRETIRIDVTAVMPEQLARIEKKFGTAVVVRGLLRPLAPPL